jgi:3-(3-hydroxy-phenyl)propionate hydroxylase
MAMTEGGELGNLLRRLVAPRLRLVPGVSRLVLGSETPALHGGELVVRPRLRRSLAGRLCPNAELGDGRRFDDVASGRFAVVTTAPASTEQRAEVVRRGSILVPARPGTPLHRWLRRGHATAALVRPDGTVLRVGRDLSALCTTLPHFAADRWSVPTGVGPTSIRVVTLDDEPAAGED